MLSKCLKPIDVGKKTTRQAAITPIIPMELVTLAIAVTVKTSSYELLSLELFPTARGDSYRNEFIVMGCSENMLKRKNDHAE